MGNVVPGTHVVTYGYPYRYSPWSASHSNGLFSMPTIHQIEQSTFYGQATASKQCRTTVETADERSPLLDFEIMRLDETDGVAVDSTVVDAATVDQLVEQAAAAGDRLYIRPVPTT